MGIAKLKDAIYNFHPAKYELAEGEWLANDENNIVYSKRTRFNWNCFYWKKQLFHYIMKISTLYKQNSAFSVVKAKCFCQFFTEILRK